MGRKLLIVASKRYGDYVKEIFLYGRKMKQHLSVWENLRYRKLFLQSHQWTLRKRRHFMIITKMLDIN